MKEKIEQMYIQALTDDLPPNVFADQVLRLFDVSGTVCVHSFVPAGHSWGTDWESCIKCGYKREQTDR
jgi:hypothetical protein